jgi:DNA polymerase-3 subunit chi
LAEVFFYHLTRRTIEEALPILLEKALEREWRVAIQMVSDTRLRSLDARLWNYEDEKFLPHGTKADGEPETQLVYLTCEADNPNRAHVRFFIEGALAAPVFADPLAAPLMRAVLMFSGADERELGDARSQWKALREAGCELVYFQEDDNGRWVEKKREKPA